MLKPDTVKVELDVDALFVDVIACEGLIGNDTEESGGEGYQNNEPLFRVLFLLAVFLIGLALFGICALCINRCT